MTLEPEIVEYLVGEGYTESKGNMSELARLCSQRYDRKVSLTTIATKWDEYGLKPLQSRGGARNFSGRSKSKVLSIIVSTIRDNNARYLEPRGKFY